MNPFPVIDLDQASPREIDRICCDTGFLSVRAHGFPDDLLDEAWSMTREFFDLPLERKMRLAMPSTGYPYGYAPHASEALSRSLGKETPPDLKETFSIGPESSWGTEATLPTQWPEEPPGYASVLRRYHRAMGALAARIMSLFAQALGLPSDYFEPYIDRHASALRVLNYPELDRPPVPGQLRAGAHTDYGSLTILRPEVGSPGLQILAPDGSWYDVPAADGAFVVNVGDLLARWSNDRWASTLHRVVPDGSRRQSIAFFHLPNWDATIACVPGEPARHEPVLAGEHLMQKFERSVTL